MNFNERLREKLSISPAPKKAIVANDMSSSSTRGEKGASEKKRDESLGSFDAETFEPFQINRQ